ncbi:D-alanyl-D-alanine carboxypeptidase family protein [Geomicrobium sp. JCM 19039]|uniref:D-alanyl-D-alanine carboxypeptidase family protein n=1 Tax=Geomicrobium sp. JCM 19039 TaxID=1460636 RepID=UPI00045F16D3|nr:D-alanyl-D-alanine carboxypeptidase family protein [Geomicrobium sp. JCM 19039]GAK11976.1 D-alanyl-D-alanine carboxypeptidase [Geomicrobium sp. JCM 19039]
MKKLITKTKHTYISLIAATALLTTMATPISAEAQSPELQADASILIDMNSGVILHGDEIDTQLPVASMSKMMTEYLVNRAIDAGELSWDDEVSVTDEIALLSQDTALSNVFLRTDVTYTIEELYESMAIYSANGATIALAEAVSGSEAAFVDLMNETASELGLDDTVFVNSTGLNNASMQGFHPEGTDENAENEMSARDTATLAYRLITEYPEILDTASIPQMQFREGTNDEITMLNWNRMLPGLGQEYDGVDGLKTGSTSRAGSAFTGTVEQDGTRLLSVVMRTESHEERFNQTATLYDYGFEEFVETEMIAEGDQDPEHMMLEVPNGQEQEVAIAAGEQLVLPIQEGEEELYEVSFTLDPDALNEDGTIDAPIEAGQTVGYAMVEYQGEGEYEFLTNAHEQRQTVPVVIQENVDRSNWFVLSMRGIGDFFSGLWSRTTETIGGWFS